MNAAAAFQEPHRLLAGVLALTVHVALFFSLYFGFHWKQQQPEVFSVQMWESLPEGEMVPEKPPEPTPAPRPAEAALPRAKADIELREKKRTKAEATEKRVSAAEQQKRSAKAKQEKEKRELDAYVARHAQEEQARIRAEVAERMAAQVGRYEDLIRGKIKRNIVMPPDVPESAKVEFKVRLLPDGSVLDVALLKSSGNTAYDNAAERAIYKAQPLPMPDDVSLQRMFRELRLTIRP